MRYRSIFALFLFFLVISCCLTSATTTSTAAHEMQLSTDDIVHADSSHQTTATPECPVHYVWQSGMCVCQSTPGFCVEGWWDSVNCKCSCAASPTMPCPINQVWDPIACGCRCTNEEVPCTAPKQWDALHCECGCGGPIPLCPPETLWNDDLCQCVDDGNTTCEPNYQWNVETGACRCVPTNTCPGGQQWDVVSCSCKCPATGGAEQCAPDWLWDETLCDCKCRETNDDCPANHTWSTASCACACVATNTCPGNQQWDVTSCSCKCPTTPPTPCPANHNWDTTSCTCKCRDTNTCSGHLQWDVPSCSCKCPTTGTCPADHTWDVASCDCKCVSSKTCPGNQQWDTTTCACTCPPTGSCPPDHTWDTTSCGCKCVANKTCPTDHIWDVNSCTCKCRATKTCPTNHVWDVSSCSCVCPSTGTCAVNHNWDVASCGCKCRATNTCSGNQQWNTTSCSCQCPSTGTCTGNTVWDTTSCSCQCPSTGTCQTNYQWDTTSCGCKCRATNTCPGNQQWDTTSCECKCPTTSTCPAHQQWDPTACSCKCIATEECPEHQRWDTTSCSCKCRDTGACPGNQQRDTTSCQCRCLSTGTCSTNRQWNATTCSCSCVDTPCQQPNSIRHQDTCECVCDTNTSCPAGQYFDTTQCTCVQTPPTYEYAVYCAVPAGLDIEGSIEYTRQQDGTTIHVYPSCDSAPYSDTTGCADSTSACGEMCTIRKQVVCVETTQGVVLADSSPCASLLSNPSQFTSLPLTQEVEKTCDWECSVQANTATATAVSARVQHIAATMPATTVSGNAGSHTTTTAGAATSFTPYSLSTQWTQHSILTTDQPASAVEFSAGHSCHALTPVEPCPACLECPFQVAVQCVMYVDTVAGTSVAAPFGEDDHSDQLVVRVSLPREQCKDSTHMVLPAPPGAEQRHRAPCPCADHDASSPATTTPVINHGDDCAEPPQYTEFNIYTVIMPPAASTPSPQPVQMAPLQVYQQHAREHFLVTWKYTGSYLNQFLVYLTADNSSAFLPLPPRVLVGRVDAMQQQLLLPVDTLTPFTHQLDGLHLELVLAHAQSQSGPADGDDDSTPQPPQHSPIVLTPSPFTILSLCHTVDTHCSPAGLWGATGSDMTTIIQNYTQCRESIHPVGSATDEDANHENDDPDDDLLEIPESASRCQAGGVCAATTGECTCDPATGHDGVFCERSPCDQLECLADGVADVNAPCRYTTSDSEDEDEDGDEQDTAPPPQPYCHCGEGISGDRCEHRDGCTLYCANGGRSRFHLEHDSCQCTCNALACIVSPHVMTSWGGSTCTMCDLGCFNGGTTNTQCTACVCPSGYAGARCLYPVWYNSVTISKLPSTLIDLVVSVTNGEAVSTLSTQKLQLLESMLLTALSADMMRQIQQEHTRTVGQSSRNDYLPSISSLRVVKAGAPANKNGSEVTDSYRLHVSIMMAPVEYYEELNASSSPGAGCGGSDGGDNGNKPLPPDTFTPIPGGYSNNVGRYNSLFDEFIRSHLQGEVDVVVVDDPLCITTDCQNGELITDDSGDVSSNPATRATIHTASATTLLTAIAVWFCFALL